MGELHDIVIQCTCTMSLDKFIAVCTCIDVDGYEPDDFLQRKRYFITTESTTTVELSKNMCLHINTTQQLSQYHRETWFHNGSNIQIYPLKYSSTLHTKEYGEVFFILTVSNFSTNDLGDYIETISHYDRLSWCYEYRSFVPFFWYLRSFPVAVVYYAIEIYSRYLLF